MMGTMLIPIVSIPGLGITTPSPVAGGQNAYPFAASSSALHANPYMSRTGSGDLSSAESSPLQAFNPASRLVRTIKRPVARASNPMLAETFKLDATTHGKTTKVAVNDALKVGGSRLDKDFAIVQSLGKGEFSQVWKVVEKSTGTMYAVKAGRTYAGHKNRSARF